MKRIVSIAVVLVFCASAAFALDGGINLYADPMGLSCDIYDTVPGLITIYVVHSLGAGVTAAGFAAPMPACMNSAAYLGETSVFPVVVGNSQTGVAIAYGNCRDTPLHILTISFFGVGDSESCCLYPVLPDPRAASGEVEAADCNLDVVFIVGGSAVINPDPTCFCQPPLAAEETTWGRVKALYAE